MSYSDICIGTILQKDQISQETQLITGPYKCTPAIINKNVIIYHFDGKIAYKGKCKDGIPEGKGQKFHTNDQLEFKGKFLNGKPHTPRATLFDE